MANTVITNKIYKATSSKETDVKIEVVATPPKAAVASVTATTYVATTIPAAPMVKIKTTSPVIGKAKY